MATQTPTKVIICIPLVLIILTVMTACGLGGPENTPTPQPDRGTLAEGEAIAIVQTHLGYRHSGEKTCLEIYSMFAGTWWTEKYLGNGVWSVTSNGAPSGSWELFEESGAVSEDQGVFRLHYPGC